MPLARWFTGPRLVLLLIALAIVLIFPIRYGMPFRLDDVLLMEWANGHRLLDAFDPVKGQIVNSVRPVFAITAWLLTHTAGADHPIVWHFTLVTLMVIALVFLARTAAYLTRSQGALPIVPVLYLVAFTAILNVFFWFSDMTYALELCFTTAAWYYGTRGLLEGRLGSWLTAMFLGVLAVLSKEPAVVMVHLVLIGTALLERKSIARLWQDKAGATGLAVIGYVVLVAVTFYVLAVSPTRSNRFFALSDPNLRFYIADRVSYYSAIYCSPITRVLLFFPVIFVAVRRLIFGGVAALSYKLLAIAFGVMVVVAVLFTNALVALPTLLFAILALSAYSVPERREARLLLPYIATILIAFATLLVTIQLVKTQLTEIAFVSTLIAAWGWVHTSRTLLPVLRRRPNVTIIALTLVVVVVGDTAQSRLQKQERILREASDVRWNANDAVIWVARNLPRGSTLAVTTYGLYGYSNAGELTGADDETKLRNQATFDAGFVYIFLEQLGRRDIDRAYLADSTMLTRALEASRHVPNSYLFVQTELDRARLLPLLKPSDTLVAHFARGGYRSEIWRLGSH